MNGPGNFVTIRENGVVIFLGMQVGYVFRIDMSSVSIKVTHRVKVMVTGYYHTNVLSTRVAAYPDK